MRWRNLSRFATRLTRNRAAREAIAALYARVTGVARDVLEQQMERVVAQELEAAQRLTAAGFAAAGVFALVAIFNLAEEDDELLIDEAFDIMDSLGIDALRGELTPAQIAAVRAELIRRHPEHGARIDAALEALVDRIADDPAFAEASDDELPGPVVRTEPQPDAPVEEPVPGDDVGDGVTLDEYFMLVNHMRIVSDGLTISFAAVVELAEALRVATSVRGLNRALEHTRLDDNAPWAITHDDWLRLREACSRIDALAPRRAHSISGTDAAGRGFRWLRAWATAATTNTVPALRAAAELASANDASRRSLLSWYESDNSEIVPNREIVEAAADLDVFRYYVRPSSIVTAADVVLSLVSLRAATAESLRVAARVAGLDG